MKISVDSSTENLHHPMLHPDGMSGSLGVPAILLPIGRYNALFWTTIMQQQTLEELVGIRAHKMS
jgi:hypothetical protein